MDEMYAFDFTTSLGRSSNATQHAIDASEPDPVHKATRNNSPRNIAYSFLPFRFGFNTVAKFSRCEASAWTMSNHLSKCVLTTKLQRLILEGASLLK